MDLIETDKPIIEEDEYIEAIAEEEELGLITAENENLSGETEVFDKFEAEKEGIQELDELDLDSEKLEEEPPEDFLEIEEEQA